MMGSQAQVLQAAQLSFWARTKVARIEDVDAALWRHHTLVRAWAMRRTMFLLPSEQLALFVRGTAARPEYNYRYASKEVGSKEKLDRLLDRMFELLTEPMTRRQVSDSLESEGYRTKFKFGGGWGSKTKVPFVEVGRSSLSVGFLLHTMGARHAICSGPSVGAESTFVRADRWVPRWKDMDQEEAEEELLLRYLGAFGPATLNDYAIWMGLYVRDVKKIWSRVADRLEEVEVDGQKAWALGSALPELKNAELDASVVRLLPFFDSFILGHKSHRNILDEANHKKVYRNQGWVSPVVLVGGRAAGTWSQSLAKGSLKLAVSPFSKLSPAVSTAVREEAQSFGRFLGLPLAAPFVS
jgi:uncharacterized protein YcaQ